MKKFYVCYPVALTYAHEQISNFVLASGGIPFDCFVILGSRNYGKNESLEEEIRSCLVELSDEVWVFEVDNDYVRDPRRFEKKPDFPIPSRYFLIDGHAGNIREKKEEGD